MGLLFGLQQQACSSMYVHIVTSLANEVVFSVAFVCLSVGEQHYSKSYEWIAMEFYGRVQGVIMNN